MKKICCCRNDDHLQECNNNWDGHCLPKLNHLKKSPEDAAASLNIPWSTAETSFGAKFQIFSLCCLKIFPFCCLKNNNISVHGRQGAPPCCQINWDIYWLDFSAFLWYSPSQKWRRTFLAVNTCPRWTSHLLLSSFASSPAVLHLVTASPHFYGYFTWDGQFPKLK